MNKVELTYNPYKKTSRILINGKTISAYGEIANFLKEPFSVWSTKIMDALYRELNDNFELEFISNGFETEILKKIAESHTGCTGFISGKFDLEIPVRERIGQLGHLDQETRIVQMDRRKINIYSDSDKILDDISTEFHRQDSIEPINENMFSSEYGTVIHLKFELLNCSVNKEDDGNIFVSNSKDAILAWINSEGKNKKLAILLSDKKELCGTQNETYIFECKPEMLYQLLNDFLEYDYVLPAFAEKCMDFLNRYPGNKNSSAIRLLNATEPIIYVKFDRQYIDEGSSCAIEVKSYPDNVPVPEVLFKISNETIITYHNGTLYGNRAGNTLVEAYISGTIEPIFQSNVTVIRRNKITTICCERSQYVIGEGDKVKISYSFVPKDADNLNDIRFEAVDPSIVSIHPDGTIEGVNIGKTVIKIIAGSAEAECIVEIKPTMSRIVLSNEDIKMLVGEERELLYKTLPADVIDSDIVYEVSDSRIIEYDGNRVKGKSFGTAQIMFYNADRSIRSICNVEVKSTLATDKHNVFKAFTIIAFALSLFTMALPEKTWSMLLAALGILMGGCGIPYSISIAKGQYTNYGAQKKPDFAFCIVGIILNVIVIVLQNML